MNDDWDKITFYYKNSKFDLAWLMRHWIIFDTPKCTNPYLYLSLHSTPLYTMLHLSNLRIHAPFTCIGTGADNFRVKNSIQIIRPVWPTFCGRKNSLLSYKAVSTVRWLPVPQSIVVLWPWGLMSSSTLNPQEYLSAWPWLSFQRTSSPCLWGMWWTLTVSVYQLQSSVKGVVCKAQK